MAPFVWNRNREVATNLSGFAGIAIGRGAGDSLRGASAMRPRGGILRGENNDEREAILSLLFPAILMAAASP